MAKNTENLDFNIPMNTSTGGNQVKANVSDYQAPQVVGVNAYNTGAPKETIDITNFYKYANHPCVVIFTLLFKAASVVSFLILNIFLNNEALVFILVVIFSAFDFWFVKNVSGRMLVGLRWWNEVKEDGNEVWIFESDHEVRKTSIDTTIFWFSLYVTPLFWLVFFIIEFIGIKWMWAIVCLISLILSGSNMVGYYKCSGEQKKKFTNFIYTKGTEHIQNLVMSGLGGNAQKV